MALRLGEIGEQDLVLEIGSGDRPNPRSDVLVDLYVDDDTERGGHLKIDRPLVVADAHHLPFKDQSFDYVVAYHILEHMDDPAQFIRELTRVGKRGHIQSPSEIAEKLFHWPFHRWYVNLLDGRLLLHRREEDDRFGDLFDYLFAHNPRFARFCRGMPALFYVDYEWAGAIDYEIRDTSPLDLHDRALLRRLVRPQESPRAALTGNVTSFVRDRTPRPLLDAAKRVARRRRGTRRVFDLDALLACPVCHGELARAGDTLTCAGCGRVYPVRRGLPRLLRDEAAAPAAEPVAAHAD
ncbi:MAG TPA: methyltransferase domain-containing protein [Thermomicrobiales bacterium]|nr:methyltransferase domain-containing protein [Thermomicrobiales bacterium]